ncbi:baseplate protein [Vibrio phage 1.244.A._10N.261.54.C3]|nr:baseplate protein [Vibrio phage 1.244.A._10N.261.54.C3]AUR98683.1 baseplate protein [Vibrio phage 1.255.O._10N.286.45.F1]
MLPSIPRTQRSWFCEHLNKTLTIQAFHIGLQTILLQVAKDDTPAAHRADALQQVVKECVMEDIDIKSIPNFVLEMIFIQARMISVGESVELFYNCTNKPDEGDECGGKVEVKVDLEQVVIKTYEDHKTDIDVGAGWKLRLRYPCLNVVEDGSDNINAELLISKFFDMVYNEESVCSREDYTEEQLAAWVGTLGANVQIDIMNKFFNSMPHIHYQADATCSKCGYVHDIKFKSINSLFR